MQIHEKIRNERVKAGLTEEQLAEKIGVKRSTYQYWETKTPNVDKVKQVAKALGLPENYFFVNISPGKDEFFGKPDLVFKSKDEEQIVFVEAKSLSASYERIIEEKEARRRDAEVWAQKMEAHYNDMKEALERSQLAIADFLKPMVASLKEIPPVLDIIVRNSNEHDIEIMKALDHLVGNAPGTLAKESGKRILKGAMEQQKTGKVEVGKSGKQI